MILHARSLSKGSNSKLASCKYLKGALRNHPVSVGDITRLAHLYIVLRIHRCQDCAARMYSKIEYPIILRKQFLTGQMLLCVCLGAADTTSTATAAASVLLHDSEAARSTVNDTSPWESSSFKKWEYLGSQDLPEYFTPAELQGLRTRSCGAVISPNKDAVNFLGGAAKSYYPPESKMNKRTQSHQTGPCCPNGHTYG